MPFVFAILFLIAPLYVWRFSIGGLPTNFLMLATFVVIGVGLVQVWRLSGGEVITEIKQNLLSLGIPFLIGLGLVSVASVISLLVFGVTNEKIAQWTVLYFQPIVIFCLMRYFGARDARVFTWFKVAVYILLAAAGTLALIQYTTLNTLPPQWWGNANEPKRAIAFFAHANAYALFATPLLAWLIPDVVKKLQVKQYWYALAWGVGAVGLFMTLSRGAWIGILAAAGIYVLLSANKKMFLYFSGALLALIIVVAAVPNLRYRVILPFYGEKSAVARLSLWNTGTKMLLDNPAQGLLLGKGVNGFSDNWDKYNADLNLEHYNFPHNIFLNFWIDLGLLGILGMILILGTVLWRGIMQSKKPVTLGLALFVVAIVVHGLIDIPYLKNDLALMFWMVLATWD